MFNRNRKHHRSGLTRAWDTEPGIGLLQCSDAPDMSGANAAAVAQAELSKEQLEWVKGIYEQERPAREAAVARANTVSDAQLASQRQADQLAAESAQHYRSTFKPIEQRIAQDAMEYDTPEKREAAAGQAMADVGSQGAIARQTTMADLAARGVDPSSGNAAATLARTSVAEAAAKAAAGNTARTQVETVGAARRMDAAGLGRGVVSSQGTQAGLALTAGTQSVGNAGRALDMQGQGTQLMMQGYSGAQQGMAGAAQTHLGIARTEAGSGGEGASLAGSAMTAAAVAF